MADDFQIKMEGLKKSYAEMIMKASKDESLRLFLRFHDHFHFKIAEAETRSLNQQMKIDELEAQLSEAEEIIVDLRERLKQVHDQLEIVRERKNSNEPLKGHIPSAHELVNESVPLDNEKSYPVHEFNMSDPKLIPLDHNSDGNKCCQAVASTTWSTVSELNHYQVSKDCITLFVQPNRETYLFKNGCTERVCAIESKPFIELSPPETVQTLDNFQSDNSGQCPVIETKLITNNPIRGDARLSHADQSLVNLQSAKSLEKADNSSQNPVIDKSHISGDPILCEKLDDANQDQLTNLSTALNSDEKRGCFKGNPQLKKADGNGDSGDKPSPLGSYGTEKNEKTIQNGLGKQVVHESVSHKAEESRSCRRSPGKNARYKEAISILRRSSRKKPSKSWQKPLPYQHNVLSSGVNEESVEVPIQVIDKMPKTEVCGATKSDHQRSSGQLKSINDLVYARETSIPSDIQLVDSNLVDVPIIDEPRNPHCSEDNGKVLKFTFYRKRRKNVLTNIDENIVSDRSTLKRKM